MLSGPSNGRRSDAAPEFVIQRYRTQSEWRAGLPALPKKGPDVEAELRKYYPGVLRALSSTQLAQAHASRSSRTG